MGLRKSLANRLLKQDIDELCLEWYQHGLDEGVTLGIEQAVREIVFELLSDAQLSMDVDIQTMQRIVEIIEN